MSVWPRAYVVAFRLLYPEPDHIRIAQGQHLVVGLNAATATALTAKFSDLIWRMSSVSDIPRFTSPPHHTANSFQSELKVRP